MRVPHVLGVWGRGEGGRHSSGVRAAAASRLYLDSADAAEEGIHPGEGQGRREFPGHRLLVFLGEEEGRRDRPWASQVFTGSNAGTDGSPAPPRLDPARAAGRTLKKSSMFTQQKS